MTLSKRVKKILIVSFSALYLAGLGYWLSKLFLKRRGPFGDEAHWLENYLGPLHLVFALIFIFVLGIIWERHVRVARKLHKDRFSGWLFIFCIFSLGATGITILYGSEYFIGWGEKIHPWFGASLLPVLLFHGIKKLRKKTGQADPGLLEVEKKGAKT